MTASPNGFVQLQYKGITRVSTPERAISAILLSDSSGRTIAIPLDDLEERLFHRSKKWADKKPQPHRLLLTCLSELGVKLDSIQILYTPTLDFSSLLIMSSKGRPDIEIKTSCSEAIACAEIATVPIYAEEMLMKDISVDAAKYDTI